MTCCAWKMWHFCSFSKKFSFLLTKIKLIFKQKRKYTKRYVVSTVICNLIHPWSFLSILTNIIFRIFHICMWSLLRILHFFVKNTCTWEIILQCYHFCHMVDSPLNISVNTLRLQYDFISSVSPVWLAYRWPKLRLLYCVEFQNSPYSSPKLCFPELRANAKATSLTASTMFLHVQRFGFC